MLRCNPLPVLAPVVTLEDDAVRSPIEELYLRCVGLWEFWILLH